MRREKQSKGITLIALVITIIVLLILTGVTINMVLGQDGIITKAILAREQTEISNLREQAELIKLEKQVEEINGGEIVTKPSLIDAIYNQLGKEKINNGVVSKDGKYDILVDDNLKITVVKHGEGGDSGDDGDETGKQEVGDLLIPKITQSESSTTLVLYLNVEQYYSELIEQALTNLVRYKSKDESIQDLNKAKQWLIAQEGSILAGKKPEEISDIDIISALGLGSSRTEFFYEKQGYMFLLNTEEQRITFYICNAQLIAGIFYPELLQYDRNQMLQYIIENDKTGKLEGKEPKDITWNDLATLSGEYSSGEEAWNAMLDKVISGVEEGTSTSLGALAVIECLFPNSILEITGSPTLTYYASYTFNKSQTCEIHFETEEYNCNMMIDITVNSKYYAKTEPYTDVDGNTAYIPQGFCLSSENEKVNEGLQIQDKEGNNFVWVPVSDSQLQEMIDETSGAGKLYSFDSNGTATYTGLETIDSSDKADFDAMVESVKKYKGFYVGKYESILVGNNKMKIRPYTILNNFVDDNILISPYNTMFMAQKNLKTESSMVSTHMIWGCQWDYIMKWVNGSNSRKGEIYNVGMAIEERHKYSTTTSNNYYDQVKNICDMEGSKKEWTAEKVLRGGENTNIFGVGEIEPASTRTEVDFSQNYASRAVMYLK